MTVAKPNLLTFCRHLCVFAVVLGTTSCLWQYDPKPHWKRFEQERAIAHRAPALLTAEGTIPETTGGKPVASAEDTYASLCASCHGNAGAGDGPGGGGLDPKPRNFVDGDWQKQRSDEEIALVINKGGPALNLSAAMVAWGAMLSDEQVEGLVKLIRDFNK